MKITNGRREVSDLGPVQVWSGVSSWSLIGAAAPTTELSYRDIHDRMARARPEPKPKPEPTVYRVSCGWCRDIFETLNWSQAYCTAAHRRRRKQSVQPSRAKPKVARVVVMAPCHPDRPFLAKGMCRPCYNRADRLRKKAA